MKKQLMRCSDRSLSSFRYKHLIDNGFHIMSNWYYYNKNDDKVGPVTSTALKALAQQGLITVDTVIENGQGRTARAGEINGLFSVPPATPVPLITSQLDLSSQASSSDSPEFTKNVKSLQSNKSFFWKILDFSFTRFYFFEFFIRICKVIYVVCVLLCLFFIVIIPFGAAYIASEEQNSTNRRWKEYRKAIEEYETDYKKELEAYNNARKEEYQKKMDEYKEIEEYNKTREHDVPAVSAPAIFEPEEVSELENFSLHKPFKPFGVERPALLMAIGGFWGGLLGSCIGALFWIILIRLYCEWMIFGIKWLMETKEAALFVIEDHKMRESDTT